MKIQILHPPFLSYITYVTFDRGYYRVNWSTGEVEFSKGKLKKAQHYKHSNQCLLDMRHLENTPGENAKKVPNCCILETAYDTYILEYIDGPVSSHINPDNVEEVYLSIQPPFKGEFCYRHQSHQTFCDKTLALKRISK